MIVIVKCDTCHAKFKVTKEKYLGKTVDCPKCSAPLQIPIAQLSDQVIEVRVLDADEELPAFESHVVVTSLAPVQSTPIRAGHLLGSLAPNAPLAAKLAERDSISPASRKIGFLLLGSSSLAAFMVLGVMLGLYWSGSLQNLATPKPIDAENGSKAGLEIQVSPFPIQDQLPGQIVISEMNANRLARAWSQLRVTHNHIPNVRCFIRTDTGVYKSTELSWRVALLPFLDKQELYDEFHHDEPWDSPNNLKLVDKMPRVFRSPGVNKPGFTAIHVIAGEGLFFQGGPPISWESVMNSHSRTIAFIVAGEDTATEWTKPSGLALISSNLSRTLGNSPSGTGFIACNLSGSLFWLASKELANLKSAVDTDKSQEMEYELISRVDITGKQELKFFDLFQGGAVVDFSGSRFTVFGFSPKHRAALKAYLETDFVKTRVSEWNRDTSEILICEVEANLQKLVQQYNLKARNGTYALEDGSPVQRLLIPLFKIKLATREPQYVDPFSISRDPLIDLLIEGHNSGFRSNELDYCLFLSLAIRMVR